VGSICSPALLRGEKVMGFIFLLLDDGPIPSEGAAFPIFCAWGGTLLAAGPGFKSEGAAFPIFCAWAGTLLTAGPGFKGFSPEEIVPL
jgi:hypothetical protein